MKKKSATLLLLITFLSAVCCQRSRQQFFRTRPQDSFVREGGRAIISCVIGNRGGRVQWTKDGLTLGYNRELPGFKRYSVVGSDEAGVFNLQILNASLHDEAEYECQVGPNGTNKAIRESANLNVLLAPTAAEFVDYSSGSQLIVQDGEDVSLTCRVEDSKPRPDIIWYIGGVEITKGRREDVDEAGSKDKRITVSSTLRFRPSPEDNLKTIACEAQHPALVGGPLTADLQIFVQYPPGVPEITGYAGSPVARGERVSLTCRSRGGNPPATLTWWKDGQKIDSSYTNVEGGSTNTYEFVAEASDNNAVYRCSASNDLSTEPLNTDIKMEVHYGPEEVEILGSSEARTGDVLTFECITSDSNPPVDVWWVVDGRAIQGNHTRTLGSETGGWYTRTNITVRIGPRDTLKTIQCQAINQAVKQTKVAQHTIGVLYPFEAPRIIGSSSSASSALVGGRPERIRCSAQGGYPLATLRWFRRDVELPSEYSQGDNHASAVLTITPNMTDNGAVLRCVATSKAVAEPKEETLRLSVRFAPSAVSIRISAPPQQQSLKAGTEASLECEAGESNPPSTVVWVHRGVPLTGKVSTVHGSYGGKVTRNVLKFRVKTEDDGSVFTCKAQNEVGEAIDAVTMSIAYAPEFPVITRPVELAEGSALVLNLTASGNPAAMDYRWTGPNGLVVNALSGEQGLFVDQGVLNITRASKSMAGTYRVAVNNSEGADQTTIQLDILYAPRISALTEYAMVEEGGSAVFQCAFTANPVNLAGIRWQKESVVLAEDARTSLDWKEVGSNAVNSRLVLRNVTKADIGRYLCAVSNGVGETLKETFLLVKSKPMMIVDQSKAAAGNRATAVLRCRAQGAPNITFTWRRMNGELGGGSKYEILNTRLNPLVWESQFHVLDINPADYGMYECTARNAEGVSRTQIVLQQPAVPDAPLDFAVANISADSVLLAWTPGFDGGAGEQIYRVQYHVRNPGSLYTQPSYYDVYPMNSTSVMITGLAAATTYSFSIQALNDLGESEYTPGVEATTLAAGGSASSNHQPQVKELTDTNPTTDSIPIIITVSVGVAGTLLLLLSVVMITCLVHRRRKEKRSSSGARSLASSNSNKSAGGAGDGLFNGSQGTSCYNDTMSEETMSSISEKSGSYISPHDARITSLPHLMNESYRPHAASTYLTDTCGIYSVEQGREIGFTSGNLPLNKAGITFSEDTESQYADELRRQAYIQTLGDGYNISQIGSSVSYPNSPVGGAGADYFTNEFIESELQSTDINHPANSIIQPAGIGGSGLNHHPAAANNNNFLSGSNTLGRASARFGSRKSPFQVVIPSSGLAPPLATPPACSTPQSTHYPILAGLTSPNRNLGEFSTFGGGQMAKLREESLEPSGHLV